MTSPPLGVGVVGGITEIERLRQPESWRKEAVSCFGVSNLWSLILAVSFRYPNTAVAFSQVLKSRAAAAGICSWSSLWCDRGLKEN